jgi:hypothetical protein
MSQHHEQQQERSQLKNQTKALYQAQRCANPVGRSLEQSSDTERRRIAREVLGVQDHESEQWAVAREEPGVREQEQSANTQQQAVAREEPGVRTTVRTIATSQHQTASSSKRGAGGLMASERIRAARASWVHTVWRLSGGTEPTPKHLS